MNNATLCHSATGSNVQFLGADDGDQQLIRGFHANGQFADWSDAMIRLQEFPRVKLAILASMAAPLLKLTGTPNFILDFSGPTSGGKTTALRLAASVWGNPDEAAISGSTIWTWDSTYVWRERAASTLCDVPLILDDTKRAPRREDVAEFIYAFSQGRGRGRGSVRGLARQWTSRGILISSGEEPATSFTGDGGTRARVITSWGSPFGRTDSETAAIVHQANGIIYSHYGHAGPRFIAALLCHRDKWATWRLEYEQKVAEYRNRADADHILNRKAVFLGVLWLANCLAVELEILSWDLADPIDDVWNEIAQYTYESDRPTLALEHVYSWANSNRNAFWHPQLVRHPPLNGWAGRWDFEVGQAGSEDELGKYDWIGYFPNQLERILRVAGFDPDATLRTWEERGWLQITKGRRQYRARVDGSPVWLVAVKREAIRVVMDLPATAKE